MGKKKWVRPRIEILNSSNTIQSGNVCLGYEAAGGTPVDFYATGTGLITVSDGCTPFVATASCNGNMIKAANGNTCAPAATVCS